MTGNSAEYALINLLEIDTTYQARFSGVSSRAGYVRFCLPRLYRECGLASADVAVWPYSAHLTIVLADDALVQYGITTTAHPRGRPRHGR